MHKLQLVPNVSVGPFVFGMDQAEVHAMMKREFGSERGPRVERSLPAYESEYYANPDVHLEFKESKLISVFFIDDIRERFIEIYFGGVKIWPRTEKKFLSIFGKDSFVEMRRFFHIDFSLSPDWSENPPSLIVGQEGYCAELVECRQIVDIALGMKKGMSRSECRKLLERQMEISDDGRTDIYRHGVIKPEVLSLTYDPDDLLLTVSQRFPSGNVINFVK